MLNRSHTTPTGRTALERFSPEAQDLSDRYRNPFRFIVLSFTVLTVMIANGAPTI